MIFVSFLIITLLLQVKNYIAKDKKRDGENMIIIKEKFLIINKRILINS